MEPRARRARRDGTRPSPTTVSPGAELFVTDCVVPVAIFLRGGTAPTSLALGTEQHCYLAFDWLACRLAGMPAEDWRDTPTWWRTSTSRS